MKIRKLIIKNYKIFDDVEFDFTDAEGNTLDTVVLAGVNGCGKTTVLEALCWIISNKMPIFWIGEGEVQFEIAVKFDGTHLPSNQFWESEIYSSNARLRGAAHTDVNSLPGKAFYFPISEKNGHEGHKIQSIYLSREKDKLKQLVLKNLRDEIFKNLDRPPKALIEQKISEVTRALSGLDLNTRLVDLESEELVFESANGQRIYFEQLSHGEQHLYFRAIYLSQLNLKDSIIMVDEPEAAFHPKWQQAVAQLYRNVGENNQVFMATHSPHIMASVPPECLFVLHIEESEGKRKIRVVNAAKAGLHSKGLEPNRILKELMQVEILGEYETQRDMDELTGLLTLEEFESRRAQDLTEKLTAQLGREDPFIILLEHEHLMLRRKKRNLALAAA